jgi:hypothetical protein
LAIIIDNDKYDYKKIELLMGEIPKF